MTRTRNLKITVDEPLVHKLHPALRRAQGSLIRVAVAGAGGNGSQMITLLARMDISLRAKGLGRLAVDLYDPEHVSMANMGRQLFYPEERGLPKATCLITRANLGFGVKWRAFTENYTGQMCDLGEIKALGGLSQNAYDVVITCVDTGAARRMIYDNIRQSSIFVPHYWLDLGNEASSGQAILGQFPAGAPGSQYEVPSAERLPCVIELFPSFYDGQVPESNEPSCSVSEALDHQDLFVNDYIARAGAKLLWNLLKSGETQVCGRFDDLTDDRSNALTVTHAVRLALSNRENSTGATERAKLGIKQSSKSDLQEASISL